VRPKARRCAIAPATSRAGRLRSCKPFQGWRYLLPNDAPPDLASLAEADGEAALPPLLRAALRELALI
jgi:hypothetical protein